MWVVEIVVVDGDGKWRGREETPFYGDAEECEQKKFGVEQIGNDNNSNSSSNSTKRRKNGEKIS